MTNQQAPEIYTLHTVPNKGERPWSGIYTVRADAEHDAKVLRDATGRDWSVVRLVVADTATTPTGPVARYKIGYHSDEWGVRSLSPTGIYDDAGQWVRYEDHAAALHRLHAENEALRATHVQNPAEIEHVAGAVSKNGAELNVSTQQQECGNTPYDEGPFALAQPVAQRGAADGFFLLLPQRPKPEAPAGTAGLDWDAYSGAQMLAFGRDCSDAAIAALRTQQPAPATQKLKEQICISDTNQSAACAAGSVGTTSDAQTTRLTVLRAERHERCSHRRSAGWDHPGRATGNRGRLRLGKSGSSVHKMERLR